MTKAFYQSKAKLGSIALFILGVYTIAQGQFREGLGLILIAFTLYGIRDAIEE